MHNERGRPVIESDDFPVTVEAALDWALGQHTGEGLEEHQAWLARKALDEARDSVGDAFGTLENGEMLRPDGSTILYLSFNDLEEILKIYRMGLMSDREPDSHEITRVDELLIKVEETK